MIPVKIKVIDYLLFAIFWSKHFKRKLDGINIFCKKPIIVAIFLKWCIQIGSYTILNILNIGIILVNVKLKFCWSTFLISSSQNALENKYNILKIM